MVRITKCFACKAGDHKNHYEVVQAVPPGMMGGARCFCKGECEGKPEPDPVVDMLVEHVHKQTPEEFQARMDDIHGPESETTK